MSCPTLYPCDASHLGGCPFLMFLYALVLYVWVLIRKINTLRFDCTMTSLFNVTKATYPVVISGKLSWEKEHYVCLLMSFNCLFFLVNKKPRVEDSGTNVVSSLWSETHIPSFFLFYKPPCVWLMSSWPQPEGGKRRQSSVILLCGFTELLPMDDSVYRLWLSKLFHLLGGEE